LMKLLKTAAERKEMETSMYKTTNRLSYAHTPYGSSVHFTQPSHAYTLYGSKACITQSSNSHTPYRSRARIIQPSFTSPSDSHTYPSNTTYYRPSDTTRIHPGNSTGYSSKSTHVPVAGTREGYSSKGAHVAVTGTREGYSSKGAHVAVTGSSESNQLLCRGRVAYERLYKPSSLLHESERRRLRPWAVHDTPVTTATIQAVRGIFIM